MRAVVQRVTEARVTVGAGIDGEIGGETVASIGTGLLVLLGVGEDDTPRDAVALAARVAHLRVFEDASGKMNRSLLDTGGACLAVSQFTLWGDCRKGRRPSFAHAARPETAEPLCREVASALRDLGVPTGEGRFGASMRVHLVNDGPVTLLLDTKGTF